MLGIHFKFYFPSPVFLLFACWGLSFTDGLHATNVDSLENLLSTAPDTGKVRILSDLAWAYNFSNAQKSLEYAEQELDIAEAMADSFWIGTAHNDLGIAHLRLNSYKKAQKNFARSLSIRRGLDNKRDVASSIAKMALTHQLMGNYQVSLEMQFEALSIFEELDEKSSVAHTLSNIGYLYEMQEFYDKAQVNYQKAERLYEELEITYGLASIKHKLASLSSERDKHEESITLEKEALQLFEELEYDFDIVSSLVNLGYYQESAGQGTEAVKNYEKAFTMAQDLGDAPLMFLASGNLGDYWQDHSSSKALNAYDKQVKAAQTIGDSWELRNAFLNKAKALHGVGKDRAAYQLLMDAVKLGDSLALQDQNTAIREAEESLESDMLPLQKAEKELEIRKLEMAMQKKEMEGRYGGGDQKFWIVLGLLILMTGLVIYQNFLS